MNDQYNYEENPIRGAIGNFYAFFKTKKEVKNGNIPIEFSVTQLRQYGLMGPWTFTLYEIFLASIPSIVVFWFLTNIAGPVEYEPVWGDSRLDRKAEELVNTMQPYIVPIALTIVGYALSWASLHKQDLTKESLRKARHAYLYLDGAYGLIPQALATLGYGLATWKFDSYSISRDIEGWGYYFYGWLSRIFFICLTTKFQKDFLSITVIRKKPKASLKRT